MKSKQMQETLVEKFISEPKNRRRYLEELCAYVDEIVQAARAEQREQDAASIEKLKRFSFMDKETIDGAANHIRARGKP